MRLLSRRPLQRVRKLWWARCSVSSWHARELHVTQPYNVVSSTSSFNIRILSSRGALGRSYSSRVYFRKLHHALHMCRSTSMDRSVLLWLRFPQVYELVRLVVHLVGCPYVGYGGFLRHPLRALTYDLSLSLRYDEVKRRAHDHVHAHHLPELLWQILGDSGIIIVQRTSQQSHQGWLSVGCSPSPPRPCSLPEVHQSVHEVFVRLETRVGNVYKRRKEDVEEEGCENPPLANALLYSEPTASDTFYITYIYCTVLHTNRGCGKREAYNNSAHGET